MEPILSKHEISDLLRAIRQGKVSLGQGQDFSQVKYEKVNLFNLAPPVNDKLKIPNFDIIVDNFARHYSVSLSNQLQRTVSIVRTKLHTFEFKKFFEEIKNPGAIAMLEIPPLAQGALLLFNPSLSFSLIEILLGASSDAETLQLNRELSTIELNILKVILNLSCNDINKSFNPLINLSTSITKVASNPRLVSITEPESEVVACTFQVTVGKDSGEIRLLIPLASLDVLYEDLKNLLRINAKHTVTWQETLVREVKNMTANITAQSGQIKLTVQEVLQLKVGDILEIDYDPNSPLKVLVENQPKFYAIPGTHNGQKAISLTGIYR